MKLSTFIASHMDLILGDWDKYALTMTPAADDMTVRELRDHAEQMLRAIAVDIETTQTEVERHDKSLGESDDTDATSAASVHGSGRHDSHFTLVQLNAEFRALRASVLRLWLEHVSEDSKAVLAEVMRFNEGLDQALAESVATFSERTEYARNMFDAILGHDLRGPLSLMQLSGELLTQKELNADKVKETGARITAAARYMTSMVNDLLDFARSRLGGATLPFNPQLVNISQICTDALNDAKAMHPRSTFELQVGDQTPLEACIDGDRVHQLLVNLLGNAGQHGSPDTSILLGLGGDAGEAVFSVINGGSRIPTASLKRIFEPMLRLKPGANSDKGVVGSLGLGLHIAREIAQAHGGTIAAQSDEFNTTFTVRLPRKWQGTTAVV